MKSGKGTVIVYHPVGKPISYSGEVKMNDSRVTVIEDGEENINDFPANWCHVTWDAKSIVRKFCIEIGCYRDGEFGTGYCGRHSLYGIRYR